MNVLLVYPAYPDTFWSFKSILSFVSKKAAFPPLGLLTVAAMLPVEWEKRLVDTNVAPLENADLEWADVVMVSAMLVQVSSARKIMKRAREAGKNRDRGRPGLQVASGTVSRSGSFHYRRIGNRHARIPA